MEMARKPREECVTLGSSASHVPHQNANCGAGHSPFGSHAGRILKVNHFHFPHMPLAGEVTAHSPVAPAAVLPSPKAETLVSS